MNAESRDDQQIDQMLTAMGQAWRDAQPVSSIGVTSESLKQRSSDSSMMAAVRRLATGVAAAALLLGVVYALSLSALRPTDVGVGGSPSSTAQGTGTPAGSSSTTPAPAPSTPSAADLERARLDVIQAVNEDPDDFAGVVVNEDGSLTISYVGPNAGRDDVEKLVVPGLSVEWRQVERSYTDLMRILREISDRNLDGVWALGIDVANNRVEVNVSPAESVASVSRHLTDDYGNAVVVIGGPPVVVR